MKSALATLVLALLLAFPATAAERRGRIEQDDCSRQTVECDKRCENLPPAERLSCKTTCRMAESECRAKKRTAENG
jgi:hypothetical protein